MHEQISEWISPLDSLRVAMKHEKSKLLNVLWTNHVNCLPPGGVVHNQLECSQGFLPMDVLMDPKRLRVNSEDIFSPRELCKQLSRRNSRNPRFIKLGRHQLQESNLQKHRIVHYEFI